jgi:ATP-binding cassette subfamily B protein
MLLLPMPECAPSFKAGNLWGILAFMGRYPWAVAGSISLLLVVITIEMVMPQVIGATIQNLHDHVRMGVPFEPLGYAGLALLLVLGRESVRFILGRVRNRLIQQVLADIRAAMFAAIQRLSFPYHDRSNTGELISRSTADVSRLQEFLFACLFLSLDITITTVVIVALVFAINGPCGWVVLGAMGATFGLIVYYGRKLHPMWRAVHDRHGEMTTVLQENIAGVRVVKAFAKEPSEVGKFRDRRDAYVGTLLGAVHYWAARVPLAQFVFGLGMPLVLWVGGREVIAGTLDVGGLSKIVFYLMALGHRMMMIGQFASILHNASASSERILEVLREPSVLRDGTRPLPPGRGRLVFENVSYTYPGGKSSLHGIGFTLAAGQTMAVVGATGSGKSTLVQLIPRFYEAQTGRILIDGTDVREVSLAELRRSVGFVFQETFLFTATVAENIAYGRPGASRTEIEAAARAAQADGFIRGLENGYDTVIGERGVSLSGGQRQRLALARAFLMDPRILVMDDATAAVDAETERLIQEALRKISENRTTLVIAHRLSTVRRADRILVLEEGRLAEEGTHDELMRTGPLYRKLFARELAEESHGGR